LYTIHRQAHWKGRGDILPIRRALVRVPDQVNVERGHDDGARDDGPVAAVLTDGRRLALEEVQELGVAVDGAAKGALERGAADPEVGVHLVDEGGLAEDSVAEGEGEGFVCGCRVSVGFRGQ